MDASRYNLLDPEWGFIKETDHRCAVFSMWCERLTGNLVGVYGSGANARYVLETRQFDTSSAILVDDSAVGKTICGKEAVSLDNAISSGIECLVLAAESKSVFAIYPRIKSVVQAHGIEVLDMYGNSLQTMMREYRHALDQTLSEQLETLEQAEAICIDASSLEHAGTTSVSECLREGAPLERCMVPVIRYLAALGKELVFISPSTAVSRETLQGTIEELGVEDASSLLLSCEYDLIPENGLLRLFCDRNRDKNLTVLTTASSEMFMRGKLPLIYGLRTVIMGKLPDKHQLTCKEAADEDFAVEQSRGLKDEEVLRTCATSSACTPSAEDERDLSLVTSVVAQLTIGFTTWLADNLNHHDDEMSEVLFSARDGYLVKAVYDILQSVNAAGQLPPSRYFYTSRKASASCADPERGKQATGNTLRYYANNGLRLGATYAFVEFVGAGTCQQQLEAFAPFRLVGFYFGSRIGDVLSHIVDSEVYLDETRSRFLERYLVLEPLFSSPEPSLEGFDEKGHPIFAEERRSPEEIAIVQAVHNGVVTIARDYFSRDNALNAAIDPGYLDRLALELDACDLACLQLFDDLSGTLLSKSIRENAALFAKRPEDAAAAQDKPSPKRLLLDTLRCLDSVCTENGLCFVASHGTLLGTIRDKGFASGDNDIDIVMPREDYDKLLLLASKGAFPARYFLQTPENDPRNFYGGYAKLRDISDEAREFEHNWRDPGDGIHIDIIPLDNCPLEKDAAIKMQSSVKRWQRLLYAKAYAWDPHIIYDVNPKRISAYYLLAKAMSTKALYRGLHAACTSCKSTGTLSIFAGNYYGDPNKVRFSEYDIRHASRRRFEDTSIPVPNNPERWLSMYYGPEWWINPAN